MNESIRTLCFVGGAAVVALVAWLTSPVPPAPVATGGSEITRSFDVSDAGSLKIVRYDADEGKLSTFEVTKEGGRWLIPSHDNYPADAEAQLKKIASLFVGMKAIGGVQSEDPSTHGTYGVKEPTSDTTGEGKEFGRVVTISDKSGDPLVNLIVGKEARDPAAAETASMREMRFVRRAGQDAVYAAEISLDALTTKFEDWIERDLLNLNSFDVAKLDLRDYSIVPVNQGGRLRMAYSPRMDTVVKWDSTNNEWKLEKMTIHQQGQPLEGDLAEDEELNKSKLDGVKTAVDDLKIIDVEQKPKVLFAALKDESLMDDQQALVTLQEFGFFVMPPSKDSDKPQILGSNGGLRVSMKDGVQYLLNFGNAKSAQQGDSTKLNRRLMVMAQIDESMIPEPELEPEEAGPEKPAEEPADDKPGDAQNEEEKEPAADDAEKKEGSEEDPAKSDDAAAKKKREQIKKENQRKRDEYNEKRKKAQARVNELNARFNNWFYVVSDDVYKKVQLGRADIVKDRETAKEEGFGVDAFRSLEKSGIEGKASTTAPPPPPRGLPPGFGSGS